MAATKGGKRLTAQVNLGQQGVNLIEQVVLRMGSAWHPSNASLDVGIDGEIELVDPTSHEATNTVIRVQSKATAAAFPSETADSFEWPVADRDLKYWLSGNAPVVLVVSRPLKQEAYWVSVKDYFATPARQAALRVKFNKREMRFAPETISELFRLAVSRSAGLHTDPRPRQEEVFSNLLTVVGFPDRLWLGETDLRRPGEVMRKLREGGLTGSEFVLRDRRILTIYDLTQAPWNSFVDRGTVEDIQTTHWSNSTDRDLVNRFIELLNYCLRVRCKQIGCDLREADEMFYFSPTKDLSALVVPYRSVKEATQRTVFQPYFYKVGERAGDVSYYRHAAFNWTFRRYDGQWYLGSEAGKRTRDLSQCQYIKG